MTTDEEKLIRMYRELAVADQSALLAFAEFLVQRAHGSGARRRSPVLPAPEIAAPADIPRPAEERVVAAIKRLSRTYPMLDKRRMLNETSTLVTAHIVQGRDAADVIDELEEIFRHEYQRLISGDAGD